VPDHGRVALAARLPVSSAVLVCREHKLDRQAVRPHDRRAEEPKNRRQLAGSPQAAKGRTLLHRTAAKLRLESSPHPVGQPGKTPEKAKMDSDPFFGHLFRPLFRPKPICRPWRALMNAYSLRLPCVTAVCCALVFCEGCFIPVPLAIYPAQTHDSRKTITFRDRDGEQIRKDGLLVLEREYSGVFHSHASRQLLDIHDGKVTLPRRCKLSSVWLYWMFGAPWYPFLQEIPGENVQLFPFISGYYHDGLVWSSYFHNDYLFRFLSDVPQFEQGSVTLLSNKTHPVDAVICWDVQLDEITNPSEGGTGSDLVLPETDHRRLKSRVDAELKRMEPLLPSTHPVLRHGASQPVYVPLLTSQPP
jgi:hypothetical protein